VFTIGTDLVEIRRVERLVRLYGDRFLARVYTAAEQERCGPRMESLAVRWAAKEAVMKALGSGIGQVSLVEIEVIGGAGGQPQIRLHGEALALAESRGLDHWAVSMSHDGGMAVAFVVASQG
jgi:holo-[acyl-carrier protein] synthase